MTLSVSPINRARPRAVGLVLGAMLLAACGGESDTLESVPNGGSSAPKTRAVPTPSPGTQPPSPRANTSTSTSTPSGSRSSVSATPAAEADCLGAQHQAVEQMWFRFSVYVFDRATSAPPGGSRQASRTLRRLLVRQQTRVGEACEVRPAAMAKFLCDRPHGITQTPGHPGVGTIVDAYEDWTDVVGGRYLARRLQATLRTCAAIRDQVTASYAIGSRPTSWGKWLWVALRVENRTDQRRYVQIHGTYWAGGLRPEAQEQDH